MWYLILIGLSGAIGPLDEPACRQIAAASPVPAECKRVVAMYSCAVDGSPGTYKACPIFEGDPGFTPVGPHSPVTVR